MTMWSTRFLRREKERWPRETLESMVPSQHRVRDGKGGRSREDGVSLVALLGGTGCVCALSVGVFMFLVAVRMGDARLWLPLGAGSAGFTFSFAGVVLHRHPWVYIVTFHVTMVWVPGLVFLADMVGEINPVVWTMLAYVYVPALLGVPLWWSSIKRWVRSLGQGRQARPVR